MYYIYLDHTIQYIVNILNIQPHCEVVMKFKIKVNEQSHYELQNHNQL